MAILGIDEVGRGPWAGPLVIGACILPEPREPWQDQLTDSKALTAKQRTELAAIIQKQALATGLGWVSATELDQIGLSQALRLAARRAVKQVQSQKIPFSQIIIDGTINFLTGTKLAPHVTTLKKADFLIKEVSAASIIAKVARDNYMIEIATKYPEYGFEKHVGYGTARHRAALAQYGPCPEHRRSFRPVAEVNTSEHTQRVCKTLAHGSQAEEVVADYLVTQGHTILERNHKTKFYEIDIISTKNNQIYFTEVKYRQNHTHGSPLEAITAKKRQQMQFSAEAYLKYAKSTQKPHLAVAAVTGRDFQVEDWFTLD